MKQKAQTEQSKTKKTTKNKRKREDNLKFTGTKYKIIYLWLNLLKFKHVYSKYVAQDVWFVIETTKFPLFSLFVSLSLSYVRVYQS